MLWMLVTVNKLCQVLHASRIMTSVKIFTGIFFSVSKGWVRFPSHASVVFNLITFAKKLLADCRKIVLVIKKRKKRIAIAKSFVLHANAIMVTLILVWSEFSQKPILCDFFVWSKSYTFFGNDIKLWTKWTYCQSVLNICTYYRPEWKLGQNN